MASLSMADMVSRTPMAKKNWVKKAAEKTEAPAKDGDDAETLMAVSGKRKKKHDTLYDHPSSKKD